MASKKKNNKSAETLITLAAIVAAGAEGTFAPESQIMDMAEAGDVEYRNDVKDKDGNVAVRATAQGVAKVSAPDAPAHVAEAKPAFVIEDAVPVPAPIGRGRSGSKYPFDALEIGQSFFVPDSEEQPDAAASLASTVSGATQRYATDHATETKTVKGKTVPKKVYSRKFCLRKVEGGARVWRVEVSGTAE